MQSEERAVLRDALQLLTQQVGSFSPRQSARMLLLSDLTFFARDVRPSVRLILHFNRPTALVDSLLKGLQVINWSYFAN